MPYVVEHWTPEEEAVLRRYFTNLESPVFALVNLPEVVKGALFARYSRSHKSLRRLFLDEFVADLDMAGDLTVDATVGVSRAERLYERVFLEYGDDSVAQLGSVHIACEQASNLLTKILEWGRLAAYLEQSTRYIAFDNRMVNGLYRYHRPPQVLESGLGARYVGDMDRIFDSYAELLPQVIAHVGEVFPRTEADSELVHRQAVRAKALDAIRGLLPAATLANVGVFATGQAYEQMVLRMRAHPLPEARAYADLMLDELRKVIPSFLTRVDRPDRGGVWSEYFETTREATAEVAHKLLSDIAPEPRPLVTLVDFDPDAEDKTVAAALYPFTNLADDQLLARVRTMSHDDKVSVLRAYVGDRQNRRHKPGRGFERSYYRFDVLSDYGAFRDLQRHRLLTIEWQDLTPMHGYDVPELVSDAGLEAQYEEVLQRSHDLYDALSGQFPTEASYAVALAFKVRYSMQFNTREAIHLLELRTQQQGHPGYRSVCQEMHTLIAQQAGHHALAEVMQYVDHQTYGLERLEAERRAEARRSALGDLAR